MAQIYLTTTSQQTDWNPFALANYNLVLFAAQQSTSKQHSLTDSADDADIVLFVGSRRYYQSDILDSELYKKHWAKSLICDFQDITIPRLPGLYVNIPKYLHQYPIYEYGFYLRVFASELLATRLDFAECKYLFSFVGNAKNCPRVRDRVLQLSHPRAYLQDSSSENTKTEQWYVDILQSSKFVLCPSGFSPSSFRIYETMRSSRVPVIIADAWAPPLGMDWNEFAIRVPESEIDSIPALLANMEDRAESMGQKALACWQANFAADTSFHWMANALVRIQSIRQDYQSQIDRGLYLESFNQNHFITFWKEFTLRKLGRI